MVKSKSLRQVSERLELYRCYMRCLDKYMIDMLATESEINEFWDPRELFSRSLSEFNNSMLSEE